MTFRVLYEDGTPIIGRPEEVAEIMDILDRFSTKAPFQKTIYDVLKVEALYNPFVKERYDAKRVEFKERLGVRDDSEILAFHGTRSTNISLYRHDRARLTIESAEMGSRSGE
jgi:lipid A disaccharide synthetase